MNRMIRTIALVFALFSVFSNKGLAQSLSDLKFTEILVINDSLNIDDFGQHSSWIEIFNSGYNVVDIGGCYLTDDMNNPTKYWIPTGDPLTKIPTRCYILFWADGKPSRGILHLNFKLEEAKEIALFSPNGKDLIDRLIIEQPQVPNKSFGLLPDGNGDWGVLDKITPASDNDHSKKITSGERFVEMDPSGVGMTIIAMAVVFSALVLLYFIYKTIGKIFTRPAKPVKVKASSEVAQAKPEHISGEVNAAIAMALFLYSNELHDEENTVLTIKKVSRNYSPWSSKIYTLRKYPH